MCSVYPAKVCGHCRGVEPQVSLCCVRPDSLLQKGHCQRCRSWAQLLCQSLFAHCCSFPSVIPVPLPARGPGAARPLRARAHRRFVLHDSSAKRSHHTQCSGRELCVCCKGEEFSSLAPLILWRMARFHGSPDSSCAALPWKG